MRISYTLEAACLVVEDFRSVIVESARDGHTENALKRSPVPFATMERLRTSEHEVSIDSPPQNESALGEEFLEML
jgi:hypothetical protein